MIHPDAYPTAIAAQIVNAIRRSPPQLRVDKIVDPQRVQISPDALPGRYRLYAGLYRVETGERVQVVDDAGAIIGDYVDLGEIIVAP